MYFNAWHLLVLTLRLFYLEHGGPVPLDPISLAFHDDKLSQAHPEPDTSRMLIPFHRSYIQGTIWTLIWSLLPVIANVSGILDFKILTHKNKDQELETFCYKLPESLI